MAVESFMLPLGSPAPDFDLVDTISGKTYTLDSFADNKALLVMFICNHCPYVKHVQHGLVELGADYEDADAAIVAISANDPADYPEDGPEELGATGRQLGYRFPLLFDESQDVARAYHAACTPDFFLFGPERRLVYRGRMDGSHPNSGIPVTGDEMRAAIDAVLDDRAVSETQYPSMGCSIKWRSGDEPVLLS
jgi:peroxiredoxin